MPALPKEVWLHVFRHLPPADMMSLMATSKLLLHVGTSNLLWRELFERELLRQKHHVTPPVAVESAVWLFFAQLTERGDCVVCKESVAAPPLQYEQDLASDKPPRGRAVRLHNRCWAHSKCLQSRSPLPQCPCGDEVDSSDLVGQERWTCLMCRSSVDTVMQLHSDARCCFLCEACLGSSIEQHTSTCVCGEPIEAEPEHAPRILAADRLEALKNESGVRWMSEFRKVHDEGGQELWRAALEGARIQLLTNVAAVVTMHLWVLMVLYSMSWMSLTKLFSLSFFWLFVLASMMSEEAVPRVFAAVREGRVGQGVRKRVWRYGRWIKTAGLVGVVVSLSLIAVGCAWDLYADFSPWPIFVLASLSVAVVLRSWCPMVAGCVLVLNGACLPALASLAKAFSLDGWEWMEYAGELTESVDWLVLLEFLPISM